MKSVLISIRPQWVEKIFHEIGWCMPSAKGKKIYEKRIEVRKSKPNEVPFKAYIYCTGGKLLFKSTDGNLYISKYFKYNGQEDAFNCKVIGEFVCDRVDEYNTSWLDGEDKLEEATCLDDEAIMDYMNNFTNRKFYLWNISDLKIYDKPKNFINFYKPCQKEWKNCPCCEFYSTYTGCCMNCVTRPPQSWCYVEEL